MAPDNRGFQEECAVCRKVRALASKYRSGLSLGVFSKTAFGTRMDAEGEAS